MKVKGKLTYNKLEMDAVDMIKKLFVPTQGHIKSRIESLIEREYMRRDDDDMNLYHYVA